MKKYGNCMKTLTFEEFPRINLQLMFMRSGIYKF